MDSTTLDYQIIDHTADLGIIIKGADVKNLFILAAKAMIEIMVKGGISGKTAIRDVLVEGEDFSDLMVRWLGEILYIFAAEKLIADSIEIRSLSPTQLKATLALASFEPEHHQVKREIKAVTYHQISVDQVNDGWEARVIFDI
jgi:SHS2 domain-containing protein